MKSVEIRKKFFDFFVSRGHEKVSSSPLIPAQDPTILFTNAGMNQFKDLFLGKEKRSYKRAVTIQKCMRAGGKHNDLDNVGFTKRHLTFFEMMGNFSFGDYFKKEAISYAWEFLTKEMGLDKNKLYVTIFETDDESFDIWNKQEKVPAEHISRLGAKDNFWQMGDTGPCGPCTEIHIDLGEKYGCGEKSCAPGCDCGRYLEIWNNVFMQYERQTDGTLIPLKQTGVDTGMGLERLSVIMQNKESVFEIDLFVPIIEKIQALTGIDYNKQKTDIKSAFHVLADHVRSSTFLIAEGCSPSNEGRGYVLRKIIRRAALFEQKLTEQSIFSQLSEVIIETMSSIYPELKTNETLIKNVLKSEIEKFSTNLIRGRNILDKYFQDNKKPIITGEQAFKLYDTYGFPLELIQVIANERKFNVDIIEFEKEMNKQKEQSGKKSGKDEQEVKLDDSIITEFTGYKETQTLSEVIAIIKNDELINKCNKGETCWIITKQSPFFVQSGGQESDSGWLEIAGTRSLVIQLKKIGKAIAVKVTAANDILVKDTILSVIDIERRLSITRNHTATHLLQAALVKLYGKEIKQSGSEVNPDYFRFDFTYYRNLSTEEITAIENLVNDEILKNVATNIYNTTYQDALNKGVTAIFGEKYNPENVRVVEVPGFSAELCGGTHVNRTGDIGLFKIIEISALSAGNRRVMGVTGKKALELAQNNFNWIKLLGQEYKVKPEEVIEAISKQKEQIKNLQLSLSKLKKELWKIQIPSWLAKIEQISGIPFLFIGLEDYDNIAIKEIATDLIKQKPGIYFIISNLGEKSVFICISSPEYQNKISFAQFGDWLKKECNLHGGIKDNLIQGGGLRFDDNLSEKIKNWLKNK